MSEEVTETELPKCALVVADDLPPGVAANAAAVLAATLGKRVPALVGADLPDASGQSHAGLVSVPLPILKASREQIKSLRDQAGEVLAADMTEPAQNARTYPEYARTLAAADPETLVYLGIALCGPKKQVTNLTGSLPLLR